MTNELKKRLEALSRKATGGHWQVDLRGRKAFSHEDGLALTSKYSDAVANLRISSELVNAFRSGDLITRQELEEAVAAERESIQPEIIDVYADGALHPPTGWSEEEKEHWQTGGLDHLTAVTSAIRARSEQKEGE